MDIHEFVLKMSSSMANTLVIYLCNRKDIFAMFNINNFSISSNEQGETNYLGVRLEAKLEPPVIA